MSTALIRALAGLAAAVILLPTSASAEQWVHRDAKGDVVKRTGWWKSGKEAITVAPKDTSADIRRTRITHGPSRLHVSMRVEDLVVTRERLSVLQIRTPEGRNFRVEQYKGPGASWFTLKRGRFGIPVRCGGKTQSFDTTTDIIRMAFPLRCLDNPGWIRVAVQFATDMQNRRTFTERYDDALRAGTRKLIYRPLLSRRIHRSRHQRGGAD